MLPFNTDDFIEFPGPNSEKYTFSNRLERCYHTNVAELMFATNNINSYTLFNSKWAFLIIVSVLSETPVRDLERKIEDGAFDLEDLSGFFYESQKEKYVPL